jgi:hypothetical protein
VSPFGELCEGFPQFGAECSLSFLFVPGVHKNGNGRQRPDVPGQASGTTEATKGSPMSVGPNSVSKETAARLRKPSWKDPRLLVGLLLVLASIAGVVALVGAADRTTEVYAAREEITVGQDVGPDDLVVVKVRLGDVDPAYVSADAELPQAAVALSLVRKGELLPKSALGEADALDRKPVGLTIDEALPKGAETGARVDVWVSMPDDRNGFGEPQLLLESAEIAEVSTSQSALGSSTSTQLHVLAEDDQMPSLLAALSNDAKIAVVLNPGG